MNNSFQQDKYDPQEKHRIFGKLKLFTGVLDWLTDLFHLTEEEQIDAGVFLGSEPDISFPAS
jgi:hypothetical protein